MGTYHTKGSQSTPKNNLDLLGVFVCVFLFFFPTFVRPHASNKILSTGKKKSTEQWGWGPGALEKVLDERDE